MESLNRKCLLIGILSFLFLFTPLSCSLLHDWSNSTWLTRILLLKFTVLSGLVAATFLDMSRKIISTRHTIRSAAIQYIILAGINSYAKLKLKGLLQTYNEPGKNQEKLLKRMLEEYQTTEYGRRNNLCQVTDRESLRKRHPLTTYSNYKEYVKKMQEDDDRSCITKSPVINFNVSSGTTGLPKHLMMTKRYIDELVVLLPIMRAQENQYRVGLQLRVQFTFWPVWRFSKSGLPIGPATQSLSRRLEYFLHFCVSSPMDAHRFVMPESGKLHIHWLYALADRNLGEVDALFAGALVRSVDYLLANYKNISADLRSGSLSRRADIDDEVFFHLRDALPADPQRADEIERECGRGLELLLPRLFPHLKFVSVALSAAQRAYHPRVRLMCGPDVPVISRGYGASEGYCGFSNGEDGFKWSKGEIDTIDYTMAPFLSLFEFIPVEHSDEEQPDTVFLEDVELGKEYEIVLTTWNGFVRYRLGDVLKVTGFNGKTPKMDLMCRQGNLLDLRGEKTNEVVLQQSIDEAVVQWNVELVDYTSTETVILNEATSQNLELGYILFLEVVSDSVESITKDQRELIDKHLIEKNGLYRQFREISYLEECRVVFVRRGTFESLMRMILARNKAVSNQFKTPRTFKDAATVEFLWDSRIEK